jgi:hypothetical protein
MEQGLGRAGFVTVAMLALVLGSGCSNMPGISDVKLMPKLSEVLPKPGVGSNQESAGLNRPVTSADLVDAQGLCAGGAGAVADQGEAAALPAHGVGLFMTECQVVQVLGAPQAVNIARTPRGDREVTMTFLTTDQAGLYRFISGRLKSIERAPGAAEPAPARRRRGRDS